MKKKKEQKEIIRMENNIIQDTSAGPIILDLNEKDLNVDSKGILDTERTSKKAFDSIVFSMRMNIDLLNHIKQIAREKSFKEKRDISYQSLISDAVEEKYPLPKNK